MDSSKFKKTAELCGALALSAFSGQTMDISMFQVKIAIERIEKRVRQQKLRALARKDSIEEIK
ncbi:MAG: hypothetical protein ACP5RP_01860, partial [Candidatus Micrarchaeia archaeon]